MRLFAIAITALKVNDVNRIAIDTATPEGGISIYNPGITITNACKALVGKGENPEEVRAVALIKCQELFPSSDGWIQHAATVCDVIEVMKGWETEQTPVMQ